MYIKEINIGNVKLNNNLILAPMAGITDRAFRIICEKFNPGLVCTEMISSKGLFYNDEKTKELLNMKDEKRPIAAQIFGSDPECMAYAAKYVSQYADIVDINMGCPAPKVVKNGDGSKLLLNLPLAEEIMKAVVQNSSVPVTVKFRTGWDNNNIVAVEMAKIAENAGVAAITIHGRTRSEFYSGKANWDIIKKVKEAVSIPVFGNGDVTNAEEAKRMFDDTKVDGIAIGRGALGTPWIFKEIKDTLNENEFNISNKQRLEIIKEHLNLEIADKGEKVALMEMRKHLGWYIKHTKDASRIRTEINSTTNLEELIKILDEYFKTL